MHHNTIFIESKYSLGIMLLLLMMLMRNSELDRLGWIGIG